MVKIENHIDYSHLNKACKDLIYKIEERFKHGVIKQYATPNAWPQQDQKSRREGEQQRISDCPIDKSRAQSRWWEQPFPNPPYT